MINSILDFSTCAPSNSSLSYWTLSSSSSRKFSFSVINNIPDFQTHISDFSISNRRIWRYAIGLVSPLSPMYASRCWQCQNQKAISTHLLMFVLLLRSVKKLLVCKTKTKSAITAQPSFLWDHDGQSHRFYNFDFHQVASILWTLSVSNCS